MKNDSLIKHVKPSFWATCALMLLLFLLFEVKGYKAPSIVVMGFVGAWLLLSAITKVESFSIFKASGDENRSLRSKSWQILYGLLLLYGCIATALVNWQP